MTTVSPIADSNNNHYKLPEPKKPASLFCEPGVSSGGQSGASDNNKDDTKKDVKTKRQDELTSLAKEYKLQLKDLEEFIEQALGYNTDKLYNDKEINAEEFTKILGALLPSALEALNDKYGKVDRNRLLQLAPQYKAMKDNNSSYEEMADFVCQFGDEELLEIINKETGKNYKSISSISDKELEAIVKKLVSKYLSSSKNKEERLKNTKFIMNLLSSVKKVSSEDYTRLYNTFMKVAPEVDNNLAILKNIIDNLKKHPEELQKFLEKDLSDICVKYGLDYEKTKEVILHIINVMKETDLNSVDGFNKLLDSLNPENKYKELKARQEKGEELSEKEQQFISKYEKFIELKQKKPEELTEEDKQFLKEFENKLQGIYDGILSGIALLDPDKIRDIIPRQNIDNEHLKRIFDKLRDYIRSHPEIQFNKDALDKATGNAYSSYEAEQAAVSTGAGESSAAPSCTADNGFGFTLNKPENLPTMEELEEKRRQYGDTDKQSQLTVTGNKPEQRMSLSDLANFRSMDGFNKAVKDFGFEQAVIAAGKRFGNSCSSVIDTVTLYMDNMLKNNTKKIDFANLCRNGTLTQFMANRYKLYQDPETIEKLETSAGDKIAMRKKAEQAQKKSDKLPS